LFAVLNAAVPESAFNLLEASISFT
jgi:hypothetical protein